METKELKITIPEGYEIDRVNSTFEKIIFKKIDTKPRSWEEYCKTHKGDFYYITSDSNISGLGFDPGINPLDVNTGKNILPSEELAEAFLAMMQLMSLRQAWIGDWVPDWTDLKMVKWNIIHWQDVFCIDSSCLESNALSFPTRKIAEDFKNCFSDLLKIAKPLI